MESTSKYPTLEQIRKADRIQIARWYRYLPSPGMAWAGKENFLEMCNHEADLMNAINTKFDALGGMTPELSKIIGWGNK
jgi:hypothetical protein